MTNPISQTTVPNADDQGATCYGTGNGCFPSIITTTTTATSLSPLGHSATSLTRSDILERFSCHHRFSLRASLPRPRQLSPVFQSGSPVLRTSRSLFRDWATITSGPHSSPAFVMPVASTSNITHSSPDSITRVPTSLRILVVDDNHVNLAVLSTLLKRRFGHLLACPPVALDSGLKALQALRTEVFDVIFMDIEMPYLNGVECTRRIRAGEDGILPCNSRAQIVAVTTKVGDEPGKLYRQVGMDGMISKPVRFEHFRQYFCSSSMEARRTIGETSVLPPMHLDDRAFFVPIAESASKAVPSSSQVLSDVNGGFAAMLEAQTAKSLSDRKAISTARTGTVSLPRRSSFSSPRSEQLAALLLQSEPVKADSFEMLVDLEADSQDRITQAQRPQFGHRPAPVQRLSSPAYMLESSPSYGPRRDADIDLPRAPSENDVQYKRPNLRLLKASSARSEVEADEFDSRASASSTWSNMRFSGLTTDSDTRNTSPSSAATTPLSSPSECGLDWQDMFSKAVLGPSADDTALPKTKAVWNDQASAPASQSGRPSPKLDPPTRPLTAPSA